MGHDDFFRHTFFVATPISWRAPRVGEAGEGGGATVVRGRGDGGVA